MDGPSSGVAIVIATRDRCRALLTTLARLRDLDEGHRVVVVDNASTDGTRAALRRRHPEVLLVALTRNLAASARTLGALQVREPYVAFCDDDSWWAAGSLGRAVTLFERRPALGLVAGRVLVGEEAREDPTSRLMGRSPLPAEPGQPGVPVLGFLACAAVVRRLAYLETGGFHPRFGVGGEEKLVALDLAAAGWQLAYVPDVVAHHDPPPRLDAAARRRRLARNALWSAWLRRPLPGAARQSASVLRLALSDRAVAAGVADAVAGAGWVLRERRPVSRDLERRLGRLGDVL